MDESGASLPTLRTKRLTLRAAALSDIDGFYALWSNPTTASFIKRRRHASRSESEARLERILEAQSLGQHMTWVITREGDDRMLGYAGLVRFEREHFRAEVAYELGPEHQGNGFLTEALLRIVDYAFGDLGLHRLEGHASPENTQSTRVLQRCGFVREGLFRENYYRDGIFYDTVVYARVAT